MQGTCQHSHLLHCQENIRSTEPARLGLATLTGSHMLCDSDTSCSSKAQDKVTLTDGVSFNLQFCWHVYQKPCCHHGHSPSSNYTEGAIMTCRLKRCELMPSHSQTVPSPDYTWTYNIEAQEEAAASSFFLLCNEIHSRSKISRSLHAWQVTYRFISDGCEKTRDTASNCKQPFPQSGADAWV